MGVAIMQNITVLFCFSLKTLTSCFLMIIIGILFQGHRMFSLLIHSMSKHIDSSVHIRHMRGITSTNLVNKEVSVQDELKIDLSKLRHSFFFLEKAESPYFTNLEKGGQKGGQGKANFSLKFQLKFDFFHFY